MNGKSPGGFARFIGIDLHKHYLVVGGVNAGQEVVLPARRVDLENWQKWAEANLKPTDAAVLEATTNAWEIYDQVLPLVGRAVVANPVQVKWIGSGGVKTDRVDVFRLASLLAAGLVPAVWVPPLEVREPRPGPPGQAPIPSRPSVPPGQNADDDAEPSAQHDSSAQPESAGGESVCGRAAQMVAGSRVVAQRASPCAPGSGNARPSGAPD